MRRAIGGLLVGSTVAFVLFMGQANAQQNNAQRNNAQQNNAQQPNVAGVRNSGGRVSSLPNGRLCREEFSRLRSAMGSVPRCLTEAEWARLEQRCGPHGLSVDRAFDRYTRANCPSLDLNVLTRVRSSATVQPECMYLATPVVERGHTVDCSCANSMAAVRMWSRRNGRPRIGCFGNQWRAEVVTQSWVRDEIAFARDALNALCRPQQGQSLDAACSEFRERIEQIFRGSNTSAATTPPAPNADPSSATLSPPDISEIQRRIDEIISGEGGLENLRARMHDVECRLTRSEGRELPEDCTNLPPVVDRPVAPTVIASSGHNFDLSGSGFLVLRPKGPLSVGGVLSGAWRYRVPGAESLSLYIRGDLGGCSMINVGDVFVLGGDLGISYRVSPLMSVQFGLSVRNYLQPGDSTFRPASGAYRSMDMGVKAAIRRYFGSAFYGELGLDLHYGEVVIIAPSPVPGSPNLDMHWEGVAFTPRVGLGITL